MDADTTDAMSEKGSAAPSPVFAPAVGVAMPMHAGDYQPQVVSMHPLGAHPPITGDVTPAG